MVKAFDSLTRFLVTSKSRPELEHLVDLTGFQCLGVCGCENFQIRSAPKARAAIDLGQDPDEALRCGHIKEARAHFLDMILGRLATSDINIPDA